MYGQIPYFKRDRIHALADTKLGRLRSQVDLDGDKGNFTVSPRRG